MKEKFIKSTIILVIGGIITKILGMAIRIVTTRIVGLEGIGLYMLVMPTFSLFITLATLSLPIAISKLVSEETRNNKNVVFGMVPIALLFNVVLIFLIILCTPFIANTLLQNNDLYFPILGCAITLPFITLSSIIRGYFFGKQKMVPHVVSNAFEQIIRLIGIIIFIPLLLDIGIIPAVTGLILLNVVSELASILILIIFLPKNFKLKKTDIKPDASNVKDVLAISIPTTAGRIIASVGQFFEPIVITFVLLRLGYSNNYITNDYGIISGYVLPMVMLPQFLSGAIASSLLPVISKYHEDGNYRLIKSKMRQAVGFCLLIGIPVTILLIVFPKLCLIVMFGDTTGYQYLPIAAIIFLISYICAPMSSVLQAMNASKVVMNVNLIGNVVKTIILFILLYFNIGMYALLFAYFAQYLVITIYQIKKIRKLLN